ncbi:ATP-dependent RNA helicase HrpA [Desulforhabdus sp. TSK]|uniref:ATP-dependent RNA helicase HrpA n=1 Tax=Desulforhabdus sp. TSK TaxID=2925014 RepID=UPI001FC80FC6|nr:ATP-dependent RNA helicase HrpA [Desulforhabdus sp. TSK]
MHPLEDHKSVRSAYPSVEAPFIPTYPEDLPIVARREEILRALADHQVLVITGETGSGKSTQIPKLCLEAGRARSGMIGCTQPRRIAAITLAHRVAEELQDMGPPWVGYKIRFQDRTARSTRIKFMTDGILLAEAQKDHLFRAYDTLIVDEAHERTLNIDFLLGLIKNILPRRPDLNVVITSATIDPEKFSRAFGDAPIIEVSGRTYPVEVRYRPPSLPEEEDDETTYVDHAVAAVDELKSRRERRMRGDVLIFMPTESDIRETVQRLEERRYFNTLVLPLFGRMAAGDQQRIFRPTAKDKIVVATNVAETSLTIPGIRYVIDTGLARISQYNARSRTQALPVAPISQASADQRQGRCGRVGEGVCIRLYSRDDYLQRPPYTPPEIQRSNLAEVILRMLYLRLGNIQELPFLDPPSPAAVKDGFAVLKELGAVDDHRKLTPVGRTMARLPIDPRLSRMLMEARKEGAVHEVAILAAALSIQDPRERPLEKEAQADQAHARFRDPRSDFTALLKIWSTFWKMDGEDRGAALLSRSQMRKFCRDHFLSYRRMSEWRDIFDEIRDILKDLGGFDMNRQPASYDAIHRSLLSGYLSHIGMRKEKNLYLGTKNRQVMIFPGSGLFNKGGGWIAAAELVQTSRLFARTAACIEPEWLEELGKHLCRSSFFEPHWEKKRGQVVAFEKVTLYGLTVVDRRKVDFGRVRPDEAREIFIRSALVEGDVFGSYGFLEHNRKLIHDIEELESKTRRRDLLVDEETLFRFYDERLPRLSDIRSFDRLLKDQGSDAFLRMTEADLLQTAPDFEILEQFPDALVLDDMELPLRYTFHPGESDDGVTVTVPVHLLPRLEKDSFDWLVPGMLLEKVTLLLKSLPKNLRRQCVPVGETAQRLVEALPFRQGHLGFQLSRCARDMMGVRVPPEAWDLKDLPPHLKMRFEVMGPDGTVLGSGQDLQDLMALAVEPRDDSSWEQAKKRWERPGFVSWEFGELPEKIELGKGTPGQVRYAYPGLAAEGRTVALRLFDDPRGALTASQDGLLLLYELAFTSELKQLTRSWVFPENMAPMLFFMGNRTEALHRLHKHLLRELFGLSAPRQPDRKQFMETVERLKGSLGALGRTLLDEILQAIQERHAVRYSLDRFRRMAAGNGAVIHRLDLLMDELNKLVPGDFLDHYDQERIRELPRYLKALQLRGERVYVNPEKDRIKGEPLLLHQKRLEEMVRTVSLQQGAEGFRLANEFRWMLEELKISVFAPEIKTRLRISPKRLDEKWQEWLSWMGRIG